MPVKSLMSWEGKPNYQWVKMHAGQRYRITTTDLGFTGDERTKANTQEAANDWWIAKLATLAPKVKKVRSKDGLTDEERADFVGVNKFGEEFVNAAVGNYPPLPSSNFFIVSPIAMLAAKYTRINENTMTAKWSELDFSFNSSSAANATTTNIFHRRLATL